MEIYILRHGVAEEPQTGQSDSERALTPDSANVRLISRGLRPKLGLSTAQQRGHPNEF